MKILFLMSSFLWGLLSLAQTVELEKGDIALSQITQAEITQVAWAFTGCPPNALCRPVNVISVNFQLAGCRDRIGNIGASSTYDSFKKKYILTISATNIHTTESLAANCAELPVVQRDFDINASQILDRDQVELNLL